MRVLGGVAVAILCPSSRELPLKREYADIDLAIAGGSRDDATALMERLGYAQDREFNTLHGHRRLYFWDESNQRQVDVFVDEADLCHRIDLRGRIEAVPLTLSLADLALLKLQVVETNEKDYLDLCAIFADHGLGEDDAAVNLGRISELAAADWGLWRTLTMVSERAGEFALALPGFAPGRLVSERLAELRARLDAAPKSRGWKLRARVGERKRWYELPEEVR